MSTALSTLLVQDKMVSFIQMDEALRRVDEVGGTLDTALLELADFDEGSLLVYLSRAWQRSPIAPDDYLDINPGVVGLISADDAERLGIVPVRFEGDVLVVAVCQPLDEDALDALVARTGGDVEERITPELRLAEALYVYYDVPLTERFEALLRERPSPLSQRRAQKTRPQPVQAPVYDPDTDTLPGYSWSTAQLAAFYRESEDRDHVLLATLGFTGRFFRRRMLFVVRKNEIRGFALQGIDEPARQIKELTLPYDEGDHLYGICRNGQYFFGDPREVGILGVYDHLGVNAPVECMIFPISVGPRAALLILGDDVADHIDPGVAPLILAIVRPLGEKIKDLIRQRRGQPRKTRASADIEAQTARTSMQATQLIAALQDSDESVTQRGLNEIPTEGWDFPDLEELALQMDRRTRHRDPVEPPDIGPPAEQTSPTSAAIAADRPVVDEDEAQLRRFESAQTMETPTVEEIRSAHRPSTRDAEPPRGVEPTVAATDDEEDPLLGAPAPSDAPDPGASSPGVHDNVAAVLSTIGRETGWDLGDDVEDLVVAALEEPDDARASDAYDALLNPDGQIPASSIFDEVGNEDATRALEEPAPEPGAAATSSDWDALLDPDASTRRMIAIEGDPRAADPVVASAVDEPAPAVDPLAPAEPVIDLTEPVMETTDAPAEPAEAPVEPAEMPADGTSAEDTVAPPVASEPDDELAALEARSPSDSGMHIRANGVVTGYSVTSGTLDRPEMSHDLPSIEIDISAFHFDEDDEDHAEDGHEGFGKTEKMAPLDIPVSLDAYDEPLDESIDVDLSVPVDDTPASEPEPAEASGAAEPATPETPADPPTSSETSEPEPEAPRQSGTLMMSAVPDELPRSAVEGTLMMSAVPDELPSSDDAGETVVVAEPDPEPSAERAQALEEEGARAAAILSEPIAAVPDERVAGSADPRGTLPTGTQQLGVVNLKRVPAASVKSWPDPEPTPVTAAGDDEIPFIAPEAIEPVTTSAYSDTDAIGVVTDEMVSRVVGMQTTIDEPMPAPRQPADDDGWIDWLQSEDRAQAEAAYDALSLRGEDAFPAIVASLPGRVDVDYRSPASLDLPVAEHGPLLAYANEIIGHLAPYLLPLVEVSSAQTRFYAVLLLTRVQLDEAVMPVAKRVFDTEPAVRAVALRVLDRHRHSSAFLGALNMIRSRVYDSNVNRADLAIAACAALNDTEVVSSLIELLGESKGNLKLRAQAALERLTLQDYGDSRRKWQRWYRKHGDQRREQWLIDAMTHKSRGVRVNAARALRGMSDVVVNYNPDMDRDALIAAQERVARHFTRWR